MVIGLLKKEASESSTARNSVSRVGSGRVGKDTPVPISESVKTKVSLVLCAGVRSC